MSALNDLKSQLRPGKVYRRADLTQWSKAVDRHLKQLQEQGVLTKLSGGVYYRPKETTFGKAPPQDKRAVKAFLKDHRFLMFSPNVYNSLGVGTTQLYNKTLVYNHKRHGHFNLGGRSFDFQMKSYFPLSLSKEFLLVDLVNNMDKLAEDSEQVLHRVKDQVALTNKTKLVRAVHRYGGARAKRCFEEMLALCA